MTFNNQSWYWIGQTSWYGASLTRLRFVRISALSWWSSATPSRCSFATNSVFLKELVTLIQVNSSLHCFLTLGSSPLAHSAYRMICSLSSLLEQLIIGKAILENYHENRVTTSASDKIKLTNQSEALPRLSRPDSYASRLSPSTQHPPQQARGSYPPSRLATSRDRLSSIRDCYGVLPQLTRRPYCYTRSI
jgi:hypothetical protein